MEPHPGFTHKDKEITSSTPMFINRRSPMSTTGKRVDIGTPMSTNITSKRTLCDTDCHH